MKNNQRCSGLARPPQAARTRRRSELEKIVRALGGVLGPTKDFADERDHIARLIAGETAPLITHRTWLKRHGLVFRAPDTLGPGELAGEFPRLIQALAFARVFLLFTDHLSDAELYARIWDEVLEGDEPDVPRVEDEAFNWDLSQSVDNVIWLTYYATEEDREEWFDEFPEDPRPPMLPHPFQRDAQLPQPYPGR